MKRNTRIDAEQIEILKRRIATDSDLSRFWDYYFTNFAENPSFREMGKLCRNETLEEILRLIGRQLFLKDPIVLKDLMLVEIEQFELNHGSCVVEGRLTAVLFFPELKTGVVTIVMGKGGEMSFVRITPAHLESLKVASGKIQ